MSKMSDYVIELKEKAHKELCESLHDNCEYCSRKLYMTASKETGVCNSCRGDNNIGVSQATENTLRSNEDYREYMKSE